MILSNLLSPLIAATFQVGPGLHFSVARLQLSDEKMQCNITFTSVFKKKKKKVGMQFLIYYYF